MSIEVVTELEADRLRITAAGIYAFQDLFGFIESVAAHATRARRSKVLIDCRELEGEMTEVERFQGGQHIAEIFGSRIQAAVVMPEGQVTKLGEMAAVNRGAVLLVTESIEEAESWLGR